MMKRLVQFLYCYVKKGEAVPSRFKMTQSNAHCGPWFDSRFNISIEKDDWKQLGKFECALDINDVKGMLGFPGGSVGQESACNAGDPGSILGLRRSAREGIGSPLQYWAFLVAQLVKNPPAMWETWVWSLGWEDPLEKGKATHSSVLSRAQLSDFHFTSLWYRALTLLMWEDFLGLQG